jgi:DMSO/TMAO reductase YedYZ heme-binding membrane subunit
MIVLVFLILLTLLAFYWDKQMRKHNVKIYIAATLLSILAFILKEKAFTEPFIQGFLGLSFFYLVMVTGALKKSSKLRLKLTGVRREYSILGFITITPHALNYTLEWINGERSLALLGFSAFIIMIPLFVTSFVSIRRKMKAKTWNLIQSAAYIIYLLLFIHLILNYTKTINLVLYIVIFSYYIVMKIVYEYKRFKVKQLKAKNKLSVQGT